MFNPVHDTNADPETLRAHREWAASQALASAQIEGYKPTAQFLEMQDQVIEGRVSVEDAITQTLARHIEAARKAGALNG